MEPSWPVILALTGVAFIAGLIDAIAGGGGLLTVPALLSAQLPPHFVFGTNKGSAVFGSGAALLRFWRGGLINTARAKWLFPLAMMGSFVGAGLLLAVDPVVLKPLVLVLLVCAGVIVVFVRPTPQTRALPEHQARNRAVLIALLIGAYDGFFGPGTGTFLIISFVGVLGLTLPEATANAKVVNFGSNLAALIVFIVRGVVLWKVSVPMAVGQFAGGTVGAHVAIAGGARVIRLVVLGVVVALVCKLGYELFA